MYDAAPTGSFRRAIAAIPNVVFRKFAFGEADADEMVPSVASAVTTDHRRSIVGKTARRAYPDLMEDAENEEEDEEEDEVED